MSAVYARTATGRPLRRESLDPRYPDLDLWVDADVRLEDLALPSSGAPAHTMGLWVDLEGPLTFTESAPAREGHGSLAYSRRGCCCADCLRALDLAAMARKAAGR